MSYILGISAFYHDAAAALIKDGNIIAAAQEERFTRKKHDSQFPMNAANYCLQEAFIEADQIDAVVFYDNTARTIDRIVWNALSNAPKGGEIFSTALTSILGDKLELENHLKLLFGEDKPLFYSDHHLSHAASAFYPSPFEEAAILTIDGVGEHATLSISHGKNSNITILKEINFPNSLGLLYTAFTTYCGFKANSGEYKLMGLAPYGEPKYQSIIEKNLISIAVDGSFSLNMDYFGFSDSYEMTNDNFHKLFGFLPREKETEINVFHTDIAASIQKVVEKIVLRLVKTAKDLTGSNNIALAGGVALNCVSNGYINRSNIFENVWIQPAAGDAGGALGAALYGSYVLFSEKRIIKKRGQQKNSYLGPEYSSAYIVNILNQENLPFDQIVDDSERANTIAQALSDGKTVGYFKGRMEFGPRALGARSILGDPRNKEMQSKMNLAIKYRESFRPFAPAIMYDKVSDWIEFEGESPYMLMVAKLKNEHRMPFDLKKFRSGESDLHEVVKESRSSLPAITHVDYSARLQTVHPDDNPDFYNLLSEFNRLTGCPVLVNTSFNVRGEPIVMDPMDAIRCFFRTEMDLLVLEDCLLWKKNQPNKENNDKWKEEFELD
jgi:carbamoyltransferase